LWSSGGASDLRRFPVLDLSCGGVRWVTRRLVTGWPHSSAPRRMVRRTGRVVASVTPRSVASAERLAVFMSHLGFQDRRMDVPMPQGRRYPRSGGPEHSLLDRASEVPAVVLSHLLGLHVHTATDRDGWPAHRAPSTAAEMSRRKGFGKT